MRSIAIAGACTCAILSLSLPAIRAEEPQEVSVRKVPVLRVTRIADGSPAEMLEAMEQALEIRPSSNEPEKVKADYERAFSTILDAADRVLAHKDATPKERAQAHQFKVSILYQGTKRKTPGYLERLEEFAEGLMKLDPRPAVASIASYLAIKSRFEGQVGLDAAAMPRVMQFIEAFPGDESGVSLLELIALEAEQFGKKEDAVKMYELVQQKFPQHPAARMAPGIVRRLSLVGKPMELAGRSLCGKNFDLKEHKGKVVIIDFWATWCEPCIIEMRRLKELGEKYNDKGLEIVGVPLDESEEDLKAFLKAAELPWLQLFPEDPKQRGPLHPIAQQYGVAAVPTVFVIDAAGNVVSTTVRGRQLESLVKGLLEAPPAPPGGGSSPGPK